MLSDKGSQGIYVDRFWGQVLRKYLWGTQGRPELCFGGFSTYGEPNRSLSLVQPSGVFGKPGQSSFVCLVVHVTQKGNPAPLYALHHHSLW